MDEGTGRAIPLRRSRGNGRSVAARVSRWTPDLGAGLRGALTPPRQLWLATLGGTALTVRGIRALWGHLVSEGTAVEASLRRALPGNRAS